MRQTDYVILGLLSESPLSGYQIKKLVDVRFKFFWSESFGQIFPALKSLRENGLIEEIESVGVLRRSRKTYRISNDGLNALRQWLERPVERESLRLELLLKVYFSNLVDEDVMAAHLLRFQRSHEQVLETLKLFDAELKGLINTHDNQPNVLRVIDFGIKVNEAYLDWSRETLRFYKEGDLYTVR